VERHFFDKAEDAGRSKIVVGAGRLASQKRPEIFLELAALFPEAQFVWYGDGPLRATLCAKVDQAHLSNLHFPGALPPNELGAAFRGASLFVLPSLSEGVPKVSQEAAASGLPVIIFGFYEAPTVINGENGFVVWSDEELKERVQTLLGDDALRARMSRAALNLARNWDWDIVAPLWEARIAQELRRRIGTK
jgi:glycosyltransferase involved in cell wall biosynthesis